MGKDDQPPERKPASRRPPPRPPTRTAVELGPEEDDSRKTTITHAADGEGRFIRSSGGLGQYGHVLVKIEPNERGKGVEIYSDKLGGAIPKEYIKSVTEGVRYYLKGWTSKESPDGSSRAEITDIFVHIVGGSFHEIDSNDMAFKLAAIFAIRDAMKHANLIAIE